jgi:hypothetical protein
VSTRNSLTLLRAAKGAHMQADTTARIQARRVGW